jgi:hypothetical protein
MYYRVAIQVDERDWRWVSTVLSSLDTIFRFLRLYRAFPQDRLRVFSCSLPVHVPSPVATSPRLG